MPIRIRLSFFLRSALVALCIPGAWAAAQPGSTALHADNDRPRIELALRYDYTRSNAPPDGCTCFNLNGGGASISGPLSRSFAWVGDVSITHSDSITSSGYSLTLGTYTAGVRYRGNFGHSALHPFAQAMIGAAHATGSLVEGESPRVANSGGTFALIGGGGLDLRITKRIWLRAGEVDYVMTNFDNGSNNRQNNFRADAGVIFRF